MSEIKSTDRPALAAAGEALAAEGAPLRARWIDETRWIDERGTILDRMWAPHIGAMCCLSKSAQGKAFVSIQGTHIHDLSSLLAAQHAAEQFAMAVVREQAAALGMAAEREAGRREGMCEAIEIMGEDAEEYERSGDIAEASGIAGCIGRLRNILDGAAPASPAPAVAPPMPKRTAEQDAALDALEQYLVANATVMQESLVGLDPSQCPGVRAFLAAQADQLAALRALRAAAKPRVIGRGWVIEDTVEENVLTGTHAIESHAWREASQLCGWSIEALKRANARAVRVAVVEEGKS